MMRMPDTRGDRSRGVREIIALRHNRVSTERLHLVFRAVVRVLRIDRAALFLQ